MKPSLIALLLTAYCWGAHAQAPGPKRRFIQMFAADSVHIYYTPTYHLTYDSCATIIRYGHYSFDTHKFTGLFRDVSKSAHEVLLARGGYDKDGLEDGDFSAWYPNGKIQARGNFKQGRFAGMWDFYYPNGKPKITFEPFGEEMKIVNAWNEEGRQVVIDGKGKYSVVVGAITWRGKIRDGRPDGRWTAARTYFKQNEVLAIETFEKGLFVEGRNTMGIYRDTSNIRLQPHELLPHLQASRMMPSNDLCAAGSKAAANYKIGWNKFIGEIGERFLPALTNLALQPLNRPLLLKLKIVEDGRLVFDEADLNEASIVSALRPTLHGFPLFIPASVNGKPVQQSLLIEIKQNASVYWFGYRLLPLED